MEPMTVGQITSAVDGVWLNPSKQAPAVTAVCTDSRRLEPGCLFLPWVGERFDGHDFIDAALDAGAAGCLCARLPETLRRDKFYIQVDGMTRDTAIFVLNRKGKGIMIIKLRGTRLALGYNMTKNIDVRKAEGMS